MGGESDYKGKFKKRSHNKNYIWLYADEHYIAHKLLAIKYPNNYGIQLAWKRLCTSNGGEVKFPEDYKIIREALAQTAPSGEDHPFYGHTLTDDHKLAISLAQTDKIVSAKTRDKIRANSLKQFKDSAARNIEKFSKLKVNENRYVANAKKVICIETKEVYKSASYATRVTGFTSIKGICLLAKKGDTTHVAGGYHWMYLEDYKK